MAKALKSFFLGLFSGRDSRQEHSPPASSPSKGSRGRGSRRRVSSVADESQLGDYELLQEPRPASCVYWGQLKDGAEIAVKRLNCDLFKGVDDFCKEAKFLGRFHHKNLLSLRGYCAEGQERMLVYDFMHNLSLLAHLHGDLAKEGQLDWKKRINIAVGCAEGLVYLHHYSNPHLVHGGIKSTNVLLSSNFEPRIVDFGMSSLFKQSIEKPRGALGYIAPEDSKSEKELSEKSDAFIFGILLLELVSGKNPSEKVQGDSSKLSIVEWAQNLIIGGKLEDIVDPNLKGCYDRGELEILLNTAIMCAQERPENRWSMLEVVEFLTGGHQKKLNGE